MLVYLLGHKVHIDVILEVFVKFYDMGMVLTLCDKISDSSMKNIRMLKYSPMFEESSLL